MWIPLSIARLLLAADTAHAVPPPDFLFNVGSQLGLLFSIFALLFTAVAGGVLNMLKGALRRVKHRQALWIGIAGSVVGLSLLVAWQVDRANQERLAREWREQSATRAGSGAVTAASSAAASSARDEPLAISNEELAGVIAAGSAFVLDAREDEEWAIGRFPGSTHIRAADLRNGAWEDLPTDQPVYVMCWSGIRGKEVTEFLRDHGILARYVENGADDWVTHGGQWEGGIKFLPAYPERRYSLVFTLDQVRAWQAKGAVLVDAREPERYAQRHIPGSVNVPVLRTPTSRMDAILDAVRPGPVITVCDDYVNCFDARLAGIKLEARGHEFLGRYNKPWEYRGAQ